MHAICFKEADFYEVQMKNKSSKSKDIMTSNNKLCFSKMIMAMSPILHAPLTMYSDPPSIGR